MIINEKKYEKECELLKTYLFTRKLNLAEMKLIMQQMIDTINYHCGKEAIIKGVKK
jgi:hypothetical protein